MRKALCAAVLDAEKYLGTHTFARAAQEKLCSEYDTVFKLANVAASGEGDICEDDLFDRDLLSF